MSGGGREWALFGIRIAALGETAGGRQPRPEATASFGIEVRSQERAGAGEGATCDISVFGEAGRSWTGTRAGEAVIRIMFEQQPLLDGRQLVHCLLALAQTQFLHLPPPLQRQHSGIVCHQNNSGYVHKRTESRDPHGSG